LGVKITKNIGGKKMMKKKIIGLLSLVLISVLFASFASAVITITEVELDDDALSATSSNFVQGVEKGDEFEVKVHLISDVDVDNVQVEAEIRGYDHNDRMEDVSDVFDMKANVTYTKKLKLELRERMDQDTYKLRIQVEDRDSQTYEETYELEVDAPRHLLYIKDVVFSPESEVKAGRALLTTIRIANRGEKDEEGIRIKVSIPSLGLSASDYVDELEKEGDDDDEATSEELYMRIPNCAEAGEYDVKVETIYDDGDEKATKDYKIMVVESDVCEGVSEPKPTVAETVITIGPESQDITAGAEAIYLFSITNKNTETKTYVLSTETTTDFETEISPSNVLVVNPGETQTAYVHVSAKETANAGENIFSVTVKSNDEVLKQIPLKASVTAAAKAGLSLKRTLEVGLIVLVVLLVILGLIIGFSKLRSDDEGESSDSDTQTYY